MGMGERRSWAEIKGAHPFRLTPTRIFLVPLFVGGICSFWGEKGSFEWIIVRSYDILETLGSDILYTFNVSGELKQVVREVNNRRITNICYQKRSRDLLSYRQLDTVASTSKITVSPESSQENCQHLTCSNSPRRNHIIYLNSFEKMKFLLS